jgi:hypothetical protein
MVQNLAGALGQQPFSRSTQETKQAAKPRAKLFKKDNCKMRIFTNPPAALRVQE